jgi:hypothetical protein
MEESLVDSHPLDSRETKDIKVMQMLSSSDTTATEVKTYWCQMLIHTLPIPMTVMDLHLVVATICTSLTNVIPTPDTQTLDTHTNSQIQLLMELHKPNNILLVFTVDGNVLTMKYS